MKNKLKDNAADVEQYKHDSPTNSVLSIYEKYAQATAKKVVIPTKIILPSVSAMPTIVLPPLCCSCKPRVATNPNAAIPNRGSGTPYNKQDSKC